VTRQSYQQGYVSEPIRTRRGAAFKIRYRVRTADGKWKQKSETLYGLPGKKAARVILGQRVREAYAIPPETSDMKFRDFVEAFWKPYTERKGMKPSTRAGYECALERHILPVLGALKLVDVTPLHIESFVKEKSGSKSKLHPKTVPLSTATEKMPWISRSRLRIRMFFDGTFCIQRWIVSTSLG
jgi:hypothetical protein